MMMMGWWKCGGVGFFLNVLVGVLLVREWIVFGSTDKE